MSLHLPFSLKNDIGHTCLKRWKACLRSAFARVYDFKKVVSEDQKEYSIMFVRAFKNTTSLTDGYDESIESVFVLQQYMHT